jgi:hypothetical protein
MVTFVAAQIRIRGTDLILVPVYESFADYRYALQLDLLASVQRYAERAGLIGTVVPVWRSRAGRLTFFARPSLHRTVEVLNWEIVIDSVNYCISVGAKETTIETQRPVAAAV